MIIYFIQVLTSTNFENGIFLTAVPEIFFGHEGVNLPERTSCDAIRISGRIGIQERN